MHLGNPGGTTTYTDLQLLNTSITFMLSDGLFIGHVMNGIAQGDIIHDIGNDAAPANALATGDVETVAISNNVLYHSYGAGLSLGVNSEGVTRKRGCGLSV